MGREVCRLKFQSRSFSSKFSVIVENEKTKLPQKQYLALGCGHTHMIACPIYYNFFYIKTLEK